MTKSEFDLFLNAGIAICAVMMVLVLLRFRSRRYSAYLLSGAFFFLGLVFLGLREAWTQAVTGLFGFLVFACLAGDFMYRSAQRQVES